MRALAPLLALAALPAHALDLPGQARLALEQTTALGSFDLPIGPHDGATLPATRMEGAVTAQAWQIAGGNLTTLQLLAPLREQLVADGFEIALDCDAQSCGGFDFRAAVPVLPAPDMYVDLGDFRFLSAQKGAESYAVLVSRATGTGFVQITHVGPPDSMPAIVAIPRPDDAPPGTDPPPAAPDGFAAMLDAQGHVVLSDLTFATGSAQLEPGEYPSLDALAAYLLAHPDRRVALVGHTDSEGSLDANIALSRRRAGSVLERLVTDFDVPRRQMEAEGMGYLAPVASNLTEEGRAANRRVEVIVTSTE